MSRKPPREVDYEDVDDIIGIAAEMQDLESDRLSIDDLREVASDLEISERHLEPAITELRRRRKALLEREAARKRRRNYILYGVFAVVAVLLVWALISSGNLGSLHNEAKRARAQVVNVTERQAATVLQWRDLPNSPERSAELSGAENRVRIERQRYDEAAAAYNSAASSFPNRLWRGLFGHPASLPLSNELSSF